MTRVRLVRTVVAAVALLATATGCVSTVTTRVDPSVDRGLVGLAMPTTSSPRWLADGQNMVKQLELLGYRSDLQYGENDVQRQISQIQAMIDHRAKALVIGSIDGSALGDVLAKAAAARIPVISYDRLILGSDAISYYATFDNFKVGVLQATFIVDALGLAGGARGPATIELFAGSPDDNNARFFFNGAMSVLGPFLRSGRLVVRSGQTGFAQTTTMRWDGEVARQRMGGLLASHYTDTHLDAVLSPYDGISRGVLDALTAAGYGGSRPLPVITGQDAELDSVKLIAAGKQSQTVYKDTRELAKVAVQMTDSILTGATPEVNDTSQYDNGVKAVPTFLLQPVGVDRTNYQRVLVGGGYYTDAEING